VTASALLGLVRVTQQPQDNSQIAQTEDAGIIPVLHGERVVLDRIIARHAFLQLRPRSRQGTTKKEGAPQQHMGKYPEIGGVALAGEIEGLLAHLSSGRDLPPDEMKHAQAIEGGKHL
jgi:hypothetical protein